MNDKNKARIVVGVIFDKERHADFREWDTSAPFRPLSETGALRIEYIRVYVGGTCIPWVEHPGVAIPIPHEKASTLNCFCHRFKRCDLEGHMKNKSRPGRMVPTQNGHEYKGNARQLQLSTFRTGDPRDVLKPRNQDKCNVFVIYRNEIVVTHSVDLLRTTCAITEAFLDIDDDWWQLWIWDEDSNRFEIYGDARCVGEVCTGYVWANDAKPLAQEIMEDDLHTIQAGIHRYNARGGEPPERLEDLVRRRLVRNGWGSRLMRPCPRCGEHWPKMVCRCLRCDA